MAVGEPDVLCETDILLQRRAFITGVHLAVGELEAGDINRWYEGVGLDGAGIKTIKAIDAAEIHFPVSCFEIGIGFEFQVLQAVACVVLFYRVGLGVELGEAVGSGDPEIALFVLGDALDEFIGQTAFVGVQAKAIPRRIQEV